MVTVDDDEPSAGTTGGKWWDSSVCCPGWGVIRCQGNAVMLLQGDDFSTPQQAHDTDAAMDTYMRDNPPNLILILLTDKGKVIRRVSWGWLLWRGTISAFLWHRYYAVQMFSAAGLTVNRPSSQHVNMFYFWIETSRQAVHHAAQHALRCPLNDRHTCKNKPFLMKKKN